MLVRLRYLAHHLEVPLGRFLIGRSTECHLSLDDALVSRRHALLTVTRDRVTVEDLASHNGVLVNGKRIGERLTLVDGDVVTIGSQQLTVECLAARGALETIAAIDDEAPDRLTMNAGDLREDDEDSRTRASDSARALPAPNADRRVNAFSLIGGVADKALALGRFDDAERVLRRPLHDVLEKARRAETVDADLADDAARYATRLASATGDGAWLDLVFELFMLRGALLPAPILDELYTVVRKVRSLDRAILRAYTARLAERTESLGPSERFLQRRLEGLERLGALK